MFGNHGRAAARDAGDGLLTPRISGRGALTLQGGVRFEHLSAEFPDQQIGPNLYIPIGIRFPARDSGVGVKDIMPRVGAAYDLFGNGRTAVKVFIGRYVTQLGTVVRRWSESNQPRGDDDEPGVDR